MKRITCFAIFLFSAVTLLAQDENKNSLNLIPVPVSVKQGAGQCTLPYNAVIYYNGQEEIRKIVNQLANRLNTGGNLIRIEKGKSDLPGSINYMLTNEPGIPAEGYQLIVSRKNITLKASQASGLFYGTQTLLQLLPAAVEIPERQKPVKSWILPEVSITDQPRFGWRGLMLDVSRHFFTVAQVKDYIDQMAKYKFNLLHLHLTDDQGWRIQIKSLPRLTEVGAWRVERTGTFGTLSKPLPGEKPTYGGFYTHEDIRDLVKYAADRYINILPEIDVPGHSLAAITAYPELSCTPGEYYVSPGDRFMIWPGGGQHFYGTLDNTICPALEQSFEFLDKVFTEVASLFPFGYIHMGGDETARNFWEKSEQIKTLMQEKGLKNLDEVQSYFVKRVEKIINSKGKKMIGWDEILDGGLAPNAAVMSWRGMKGGVEAARQGHEVVMSPTDFAYIDYMQGDASIEPPVYSTLRLKKAYQFEPVPEGVNPALIKGGQANLWTEQVYNTRHLQYMTWPRAMAIAEALWSKKENRQWDNFSGRVESHFSRLDAAGIKYAPSMYDPIVSVTAKDSILKLSLSMEISGLSIHYSFDNSFPDQFYPEYKDPLLIPKDASTVKMISCRNNRPIGRMLVISVAELKKRAGLK